MKIIISLATGAALAALSLPASAQVVGGNLAGNVGVGAGVQTPGIEQVTGTVGQTARGAVDLTQDTTRDASDMLRNSLPSAEVTAEAGVQADAGAQGPASAAQASAGAMVHGSDGAMLGRVVDVTRDTAGRVQAYVVQTTDGGRRLLPSASAQVRGEMVVASQTDLQPAP